MLRPMPARPLRAHAMSNLLLPLLPMMLGAAAFGAFALATH